MKHPDATRWTGRWMLLAAVVGAAALTVIILLHASPAAASNCDFYTRADIDAARGWHGCDSVLATSPLSGGQERIDACLDLYTTGFWKGEADDKVAEAEAEARSYRARRWKYKSFYSSRTTSWTFTAATTRSNTYATDWGSVDQDRIDAEREWAERMNDALVVLGGWDEYEVFVETTVTVAGDDYTFMCANIDDIIRSKETANRPKDRPAVERLLAQLKRRLGQM